jgi:hypothetical protein
MCDRKLPPAERIRSSLSSGETRGRRMRVPTAARANLLHAYTPAPLYLLDPKFQTSPGGKSWTRKLRALIEAVGQDVVARQLFVAEVHGYHSKRYRDLRGLLSQQYTLDLVSRGVDRGAFVAIMRSAARWQTLVPKLDGYDRVSKVRSVQNPSISPRNCPEVFDAIVAELKSVR